MKQTVAAILYTGLRIGKITTAGTALAIQRAVAKHTVKVLRIRTLVAGEIAAIPVCKICMVVFSHSDAP